MERRRIFAVSALVGGDGLRQLVRGEAVALGQLEHAQRDHRQRAQLGDLVDERIEFWVG